MSRRSIRQSAFVENWAQAVHAAETAGASAVVVFNDLDGMAPFRMGLFGERSPSIPAFMVSGTDGIRCLAAANRCIAVFKGFLLLMSVMQSLPRHHLRGPCHLLDHKLM